MEPPGLKDSPSRVTIKRDWLYFRAMRIASSLHHPFILLICPHQGAGKADGARFHQGLRLRKAASSAHAGQGQEGRPSEAVPFQIFDEPLGGVLILRHDILDASAQGGLNGSLIALIHLNQIRNDAFDSRHLLLLLHDLPDTVAVAIVTLGHIPEGFQTGGLPVKGALAYLQLLVLFPQLPPQTLGFCLFLPLTFGQLQNSAGDGLQLFLVTLVKSPLFLLAAFGQ